MSTTIVVSPSDLTSGTDNGLTMSLALANLKSDCTELTVITPEEYFELNSLFVDPEMVAYVPGPWFDLKAIEEWEDAQNRAYYMDCMLSLSKEYLFPVKESDGTNNGYYRKCFMQLKTFNNLRF